MEIPTGYYDNISNVIYYLKQLILATNKFWKDDLNIRYASVDKRTSVFVKTAVTYDSKMMLPVLGFEPGTTILKQFFAYESVSFTNHRKVVITVCLHRYHSHSIC